MLKLHVFLGPLLHPHLVKKLFPMLHSWNECATLSFAFPFQVLKSKINKYIISTMTINGTSNYNTKTSHKAYLYKTTLKQHKYNIFNESPKYLSYFSSIYLIYKIQMDYPFTAKLHAILQSHSSRCLIDITSILETKHKTMIY